MWIMTTFGIVSVTDLPMQDRLPGEQHLDLLVRARDRTALDRLWAELVAAHGLDAVGIVQETPERDYQFRLAVARTWFKVWMAEQVEGITYTNFKQSVESDAYRHLLDSVWAVVARFYSHIRG